eukprot:3822218-Pyramimonas_sp.AAC.1
MCRRRRRPSGRTQVPDGSGWSQRASHLPDGRAPSPRSPKQQSNGSTLTPTGEATSTYSSTTRETAKSRPPPSDLLTSTGSTTVHASGPTRIVKDNESQIDMLACPARQTYAYEVRE